MKITVEEKPLKEEFKQGLYKSRVNGTILYIFDRSTAIVVKSVDRAQFEQVIPQMQNYYYFGGKVILENT